MKITELFRSKDDKSICIEIKKGRNHVPDLKIHDFYITGLNEIIAVEEIEGSYQVHTTKPMIISGEEDCSATEDFFKKLRWTIYPE